MTKNMKYDFQQPAGEIESLEIFKMRLAKQMLLNAFFQDEKKQEFDIPIPDYIFLFPNFNLKLICCSNGPKSDMVKLIILADRVR